MTNFADFAGRIPRDLDLVKADRFIPRTGTYFQLFDGETAVALELIEVKPLPASFRPDPFALLFRSESRVPQGVYRFEHAECSAGELFVTPVGFDGRGFLYESIFN